MVLGASRYAFSIGALHVHGGVVVGLWWTFFFSPSYLSSPYQNINVSFNYYFLSNLVLILLISICFVSYLFFIDFFLQFRLSSFGFI
jgi:hypothetical protein